MTPSRSSDSRSIRTAAPALESCDSSRAASACSCTFSRPSSSSWTLSRSTATLMATMPASKPPRAAIQRTPPASGRRSTASDGTREARGIDSVREVSTKVDIGGLHLHRRAQASRPGARVDVHLAVRWPHGLAGEDSQLGLLPAHAHRELGRAGAAFRLLAEEALDDAVLERMKADHREAAAGPQHR